MLVSSLVSATVVWAITLLPPLMYAFVVGLTVFSAMTPPPEALKTPETLTATAVGTAVIPLCVLTWMSMPAPVECTAELSIPALPVVVISLSA